ncbi:MAG: YkgJ family cysteine cluster protein [Vampirovibrionales bacterium]|nr:YkgJ family cysteine cluster protein [Vampirovibrionales bacterium]
MAMKTKEAIGEIPAFAGMTDAPAVTFSCSQCGECCNSILIRIETEKALELQARQWVKERLAQFGKRLSRENAEHWLIPHRPDKSCVFLGDARQCLIEQHEGKRLKPSECLSFPFAGLSLPSASKKSPTRLFDCSASCKHVAEDLLDTFAAIVPETAWQETLPLQNAPQNVRLSFFQRVSWAEYLQRLSQLKPVFTDPSLSAESALKAARLILYGHLFYQPPQANTSTFKLSGFKLSGICKSFLLLLFLRKPYGTLSRIQLLRKRAYQDPYVFGSLRLPGVFETNDAVWDASAERLLKSFAYAILHRHVLLSQGHWGASLIAIALLAVILVRWYATVLSEIEGLDHTHQLVSRQQVASAIRLVERYYTGHQPRFLAFFNHRIVGLPLGWMMQHRLV